jgi:pilus assembly protein CpaE
VTRPTVVVALPAGELDPVMRELEEAGFPIAPIAGLRDLEALRAKRTQIGVAIIDAETDVDGAIALRGAIAEDDPGVAALMVVSVGSLEQLAGSGALGADDEIVTRPYAADEVRWRVEAMCIHAQVGASSTSADSVLIDGDVDINFGPRAQVVAVFSPKGGVGKTTVATSLAAAAQVRKHRRVLLVDADTVTGHVTTSLALEGMQTVADAWQEPTEDGRTAEFLEIASTHASGLRVVALTLSPLHTEPLHADRVARAIDESRRGVDLVVVDLHPSYHDLNLAIFGVADRILVPVTPDIPAIRAAVQFVDVAKQLGIGDRLSMVVNRANSGVSVEDMERTVDMEALALIRSGGLLFTRASNEGRTVIDLFPREKVTEDFDVLADRVLGRQKAGSTAQTAQPARPLPLLGGLLGRKEPARIRI